MVWFTSFMLVTGITMFFRLTFWALLKVFFLFALISLFARSLWAY